QLARFDRLTLPRASATPPNRSSRSDREVRMTSSDRVLLAGNDPAFLQTALVQLRKEGDGTPMACRLDGVRPHLTPQSDGLILMIAATPADGPAVRGLMQELRLLQLAPRLVLLETPAAEVGPYLNGLEGLLAERRPWAAG